MAVEPISITIVSTLFTSLDETITKTIATGTSKLMSTVSPIFMIGVCIYFGLKALRWYTKGADMPVMELFEDFVKMTLICFFSFNVGNYLSYVVPAVSGLSDDICALLSTENGTTANLIDKILTDYINMIRQFIGSEEFKELSFFDDFDAIVTAIIALAVMIIAGIPFIVITCAILFTVALSLKIFLVIGPLFIAFSLYPATRDMFFGWLRMISSFIVINILFSIVCTLEINFIRDHFLKGGLPNWADIGGMFVCFGAFIYLSKSLPSYASSITGGMGIAGISAPNIGGGLRRLLSPAGKGAKAATTRLLQSRRNSLKPG